MKAQVLVVDDSAVNRSILRRILEDEFQIVEAENGAEAIEIIYREKTNIAIVLLDLIMPVMDGFHFMQKMREQAAFASIPIIVMTQKEGIDTEIESLSYGANDYIVKPYHPVIIKNRVRNALSLNEAAALRNFVETDTKTGVYNKETFYSKTEEYMRKHETEPVAIMSLDVERFKLINDLFGTEEGDRLLYYIGQFLKQDKTIRAVTVGRVGADQFVFCVPCREGCAEQILEVINKKITEYPLDIHIIIKMGVYRVTDRSIPVNLMSDRAILAGDTVKGSYGAQYAMYSEKQREHVLFEQQIINDVNRALREEEFQVLFQPQVDLQTNVPIGAETLLRWNHPTKGLLKPDRFISLCEKNGGITLIDEFVWRKSCSFLRKWVDSGGDPIRISANVSRVDIYNPKLCSMICDIADEYGIPHEMFGLEITESAYMENPEMIKTVVQSLQQKGFTVEMDDFGSGYSSLNMLCDIEMDVMKIDAKFLRDYEAGMRGKCILQFVIQMAQLLNLPLIVEGVETQEQANALKELGCETAQGYLYGKPMDETIAMKYFKTHCGVEKQKGEK